MVKSEKMVMSNEILFRRHSIFKLSGVNSEANPELNQTSDMKPFAKTPTQTFDRATYAPHKIVKM